jgi:tight adherence protein C
MGSLPALLVSASLVLAAAGLTLPSTVSLAGLEVEAADRPTGGRRQVPLARRLEALGRVGPARSVVGTARLARRLELAGGRLSLDAVAGLGMGLGVAILTVGLVGTAVTPLSILLCPVGFLAGARAPALVLGRLARQRQDRIARAVPGMVEVLVATTEAGLGPAVAFRRTAEVLGGPMGQELRLASREMDLGLPWEAALVRLEERTEVPSLRRLVATLTRSHRLGTSVGTSLRRVAGDLRRERRARAEEMARKAPIKMLFPLVFLILPAFLLLTVGPVLLATIKSLS